jgi:hypothetical protein
MRSATIWPVDEIVGRGDDKPVEVRLAQTIAWCEPRADLADPRGSLRDDQLSPPVLEPDRQATVRGVVSSRDWRPEVRAASPVSSAADLRGGRLLVYFPDEELSDGAAEAETRGFFDVNNAPPWDTWVGLFRDDEAGRSGDYLVSWVPRLFVELVDRGIYVNPEECIRWLDSTNLAVAAHLRAQKILPGA